MKLSEKERHIYARGMKAKYIRFICIIVAVVVPMVLSPVVIRSPIIAIGWGLAWAILGKLWSERWEVYQLLQKYDQHIAALEQAVARGNRQIQE